MDMKRVNARQFAVTAIFLSLLIGCSPASDVSETATVDSESLADEATSSRNTVSPAGFVADDFVVPVLVEDAEFKVVPLGPDLVQIDFDAYMSSIEHLQKTFSRSTSWPREGITDEEAMLDMLTEQARFEKRESFAYAVLTPDGSRELGCVYVRPSKKPGFDAQVSMWVTQAEFDKGFDAELFTWVQEWISSSWPFTNVAYPGRLIEWATWDALPDQQSSKSDDLSLQTRNKQTAEAFIDAFYSFDATRLGGLLAEAGDSATSMLYYQGWAEGGNYKVLERGACEAESAELFRCAITVQDDPVVALNTGFNVTDTFALTFSGTDIVSIDTSSNDQPIYYEAREWVEANMPELVAGPCKGRGESDYVGETTPGDCARAMTKGYQMFYAATKSGTPVGD